LARRLRLSVGCVIKAIDNDVAIIDRSFGFETAVQEAVGNGL
jgi:6-phosphofructokinase 1